MIRVGQVVGAHGLGGAVKVLSLTDYPDRFEPGAELHLAGSVHRVEWRRGGPERLLLKLSGVANRLQAEAHRGSYLEVPETAAREEPDSWYADQVLGLAVVTAAGRRLGRLAQILPEPAHDVWVARQGRAEYLIPAVAEAVLAVDLEAKRITVADWLLEVEEA